MYSKSCSLGHQVIECRYKIKDTGFYVCMKNVPNMTNCGLEKDIMIQFTAL